MTITPDLKLRLLEHIGSMKARAALHREAAAAIDGDVARAEDLLISFFVLPMPVVAAAPVALLRVPDVSRPSPVTTMASHVQPVDRWLGFQDVATFLRAQKEPQTIQQIAEAFQVHDRRRLSFLRVMASRGRLLYINGKFSLLDAAVAV